MNRRTINAFAVGLVALMAAGCVSEGRSYVVNDSPPRYNRPDRNDWNDRNDRDRGRPDYDRRDRGDQRGWDGRRDGDDRGRGDDRNQSSRPGYGDRDGRWIIRDGRRIWVADQR